MLRNSIVILCCFFLLSCQENKQSVQEKEPQLSDIQIQSENNLKKYMVTHSHKMEGLTPAEWEHLRWVSKALIVLRAGRGLKTSEPYEPYLQKNKEQIVDDLISGKDFPEAVLKFNLYFLGLNKNTLRVGDQWDPSIFDFPSALNSSIEVRKNGNYFELLNGAPKTPLSPLAEPLYDSYQPEVELTDHQKRERIFTENLRNIQDMQDWLKSPERPISWEEYCNIFSLKNITLQGTGLTQLGSAGGFINIGFIDHITKKIIGFCPSATFLKAPIHKPDPQKIITSLELLKGHLQKLINLIFSMEGYKTSSDLKSFRSIDLTKMDSDYSPSYFENQSRFMLANSSTNINRKRAAYILDRFLCDNLIPIDIETPNTHGGGSHGSDPSCMACHYRLDPMAGFFKDRGAFFRNFDQLKSLVHDDFAFTPRNEFEKNWLNPPGSARKWNIGVVRSVKDESKNQYGENLKDMFSILKKMPEVKKCITRRLFEYTTSQTQNVDQGFLSDIATQFTNISKINSTEGIKFLFKSFVLSKTFSHKDPKTTECYDYPPNFDPDGRAPCQVSYILQNKCAGCHYPYGGAKGLDLTSWKEFEPNRFGFIHEPDGSQLSLNESFTRILKALSSSDPAQRMPLRQHMDPVDRETLYLWVDEQIQ